MTIQGFTRLRKQQFGRQTSIGTNVQAKRAYPFRGVPDPNLNWTDPDIDVGSIDPVASPIRGIPALSAALTDGGLKYNNLPIQLSAIFGGGVDGSPGASPGQTWTLEPASTDPLDAYDVYTYEFGDDVVTDYYQLGDGTLSRLEITGPEGLAALTTSMTWQFGSFRDTGSSDSPVTGTVPTPGLTVANDDVVVYLKDASIFIATDFYDLDSSQITDALHSFILRINQATDEKRFVNGTQTFDVSGYGRGARTIELELTFAKTDDTVGTGSESDAWMSDNVVNRYVKVVFESVDLVSTGPDVPYSWEFSMPMRYFTRAEDAVGGNTVIKLTGHAFFDDGDFNGVFRSVLVNTLPTAEL